MFVPRVIALALSAAALAGTPGAASAMHPVYRPFLIHTQMIDGPEVVFTNRYAGLVGFTVPQACGRIGGLAYSDHFIFGARKGRVWLDGIASCPALRD